MFDKKKLGAQHYRAGIPYNQIYDKDVLNGWLIEERNSQCGFRDKGWNKSGKYTTRQLMLRVDNV